MPIFDEFEETTYVVPKQGMIGKVGILIITTNPNCLEVSTRRIIGSGYSSIDKTGFVYGDNDCKPELFSILFTIEGIEKILLKDRYTMMIAKACSFSWEEILPQVCVMIEQWQS